MHRPIAAGAVGACSLATTCIGVQQQTHAGQATSTCSSARTGAGVKTGLAPDMRTLARPLEL